MSADLSRDSALVHQSQVVHWLAREIDTLHEMIPVNHSGCQVIAQNSLLKVFAAWRFASGIPASNWRCFSDTRSIGDSVELGDSFFHNAHIAIIAEAGELLIHAWGHAMEVVYDNDSIPEDEEVDPLLTIREFLSAVHFPAILSEWTSARKYIQGKCGTEWSRKFKQALQQLEREQQVVFGESVLASEELHKPIAGWSLEEFTNRIVQPPTYNALPAPKAPSPPSPSVELNGLGEPVLVLGGKKEPLTDPQYDVVQCLIEAGEAGLNKDDLIKKSGHSDARGIIKRLKERDQDWDKVLNLPGKPGGKYRIRTNPH